MGGWAKASLNTWRSPPTTPSLSPPGIFPPMCFSRCLNYQRKALPTPSNPTPVRRLSPPSDFRCPGTVLRKVRKGEGGPCSSEYQPRSARCLFPWGGHAASSSPCSSCPCPNPISHSTPMRRLLPRTFRLQFPLPHTLPLPKWKPTWVNIASLKSNSLELV